MYFACEKDINLGSSEMAECYGLNCILSNLYVEVLTRTILGDREFKEIFKMK